MNSINTEYLSNLYSMVPWCNRINFTGQSVDRNGREWLGGLLVLTISCRYRSALINTDVGPVVSQQDTWNTRHYQLPFGYDWRRSRLRSSYYSLMLKAPSWWLHTHVHPPITYKRERKTDKQTDTEIERHK